MADEPKRSAGGSSDTDYEVGYGKPPRHTQFKPGQSGNPSGRPKGTKNLKTDLSEVLGEMIVVREGDRSQSVSKQRAMLMALLARALNGDVRAVTLVLSTMIRLLDIGEGSPDAEEAISEDELKVYEELVDRLRRSSSTTTRPEPEAGTEEDNPA